MKEYLLIAIVLIFGIGMFFVLNQVPKAVTQYSAPIGPTQTEPFQLESKSLIASE